MYDTLNIVDINIDDILKYTTEYDIYSFYLNHSFVIGRPFSSPFRNDKNPSFVIFKSNDNKLLYKDFGQPDIVGDVIKFVQINVEKNGTKKTVKKGVKNH